MHYQKIKQKKAIVLPEPNSNKTMLLRDLILHKMISEQEYRYNRFRGDISDLRLKFSVPIRHAPVPFKNTWNRKNKYHVHYLMKIDQKKAIKTYLYLHAQASKTIHADF